jgi:DNA-directed RNA polymerase specialized sigma24 family protein
MFMEEMLELAPPVIRTREQLLTEFYKETFPGVAKYIQRKGGTLEEAKDIFHEALLIYYEKGMLKSDPVQHEKAYLMGIAKHLWSKRFQDKIRVSSSPDVPDQIPDTKTPPEPSAGKLLAFLQQAGEKCMELLQSYYYEKASLPQIAERFGFSGTRSATVQKYKCLEKVRNSVQKKSLQYEDFLD